MDKPEFVLHRAPWVVPISAPPIADGAVLACGDTVISVGPFRLVQKEMPANTRCIDHDSAAIMPALVNAHTHLELSALRGQIPLPQQSFAHWLKELFSRRIAVGPEDVEKGAAEGEKELRASGVALYGDISNGSFVDAADDGRFPMRHAFWEVLGFDRQSLGDALEPEKHRAFQASAERNPTLSFAAHACYSTSADIIRQAKGWCRERNRVFSIHVSEHDDEIRFLQDGSGFCRDLLESLGKWIQEWTPPAKSPVRYLEDLGVLDAGTLLVHCVHMTDSDWETVRDHGCSVCFCPRSNANINTGPADVPKALRTGVPVALGTDSLASNTDLNLFSEGIFLLDQFRSLNPRDVLFMMTLGGARALGRQNLFGTIESGSRLPLLEVILPSSQSPPDLLESILHQGKEGAIQWIN